LQNYKRHSVNLFPMKRPFSRRNLVDYFPKKPKNHNSHRVMGKSPLYPFDPNV